MGGVIRVLRLAAILAWTLVLLPLQVYGLIRQSPLRTRIPVVYHRGVARILGFKVETWGARSAAHPTLFVANHTSWLDIVVLSCAIPGSFVSKAEVRHWPFFGTLAKLQRSVFIDRQRHQVANHRDEIGTRLDAGDDLILFPEGTSSDGNRVLPFKSALFAVAQRAMPLTVQPVTVAYTHLDDMPMGRHFRPLLAWYGDMRLGRHLWGVLGLGPVTVAVVFHPPVVTDAGTSRKELADRCRTAVANGLSRALMGRLDGVAAAAEPGVAPSPAA
jgi:1-acyl-sn-glycerol-3-phosphate acyltransferase